MTNHIKSLEIYKAAAKTELPIDVKGRSLYYIS